VKEFDMPVPTGSVRCQDARQRLSLLQDGELAPEQQARSLAHLEACPECRAAYAQLQAAWEALDGLAAPQASREFVASVLESVEAPSVLDRLRALAPAPARFMPAPVALALTLLVGLVAGGLLGTAAMPGASAHATVEVATSTLGAVDAFSATPQGSLAQGYLQLAGLEGR
jgi:anti-sigma factor RsiW